MISSSMASGYEWPALWQSLNPERRRTLNDEMNMSMSRFLEQVRVTSQQAVGAAMRVAGVAADGKAHKARVALPRDSLDLEHVVDGAIKGNARK